MAGLGNALKRPFSMQRIKDAGITGINPKRGLRMLKEDVGDVFKAPTAPVVAAPPPMPMADGVEIEAAKRKRTATMQNRGGRMSTVLSEERDRFGG